MVLFIGLAVRQGVKAYKAYDKKQKQKKEEEELENNAAEGTLNVEDFERLNLNDSTSPSANTSSSSRRESDSVPQQYRDEKKSRDYDSNKEMNENPFDAPPSYNNTIEQSCTVATTRDVGSSSDRQIYNGETQNVTDRRPSDTSSNSSGSSAASNDINQRSPGLSRSEYKALRRQHKLERRIERRELKAARRGYGAGYMVNQPMLNADMRVGNPVLNRGRLL